MTVKNLRIYSCLVEGMHITIIVYLITNKLAPWKKKLLLSSLEPS